MYGTSQLKDRVHVKLFFLLVVLNVGENPTGRSQDSHCEHPQSEDCLSRAERVFSRSGEDTGPLGDHGSPQSTAG